MLRMRNAILSIFCFVWVTPSPADPVTQALLKIKEAQVARKHIGAYAQKLKPVKKFSGKPTQTNAYLKVEDDLVKKKWVNEIKKYQQIVDEALINEDIFNDTHYVFYHAQRSQFRILHDFIKELYEVFTTSPELTDFYFLRGWYETVDAIDVKAFLEKNKWYLGTGWTHDDSARMICANLSLFGNSNNLWECSFSYFVKNFNIFPSPVKNFLHAVFDRLNLDYEYFHELMKLGESVTTNEGVLYQIFIPKAKVDKYVYLSDVGTKVWSSVIIDSCFDYAKWHHPFISPILEKYCSEPALIPSIDTIQARILVSKDLLLNPFSGIKIFRFSAVDPVIEVDYVKKLKEMVTKIIYRSLADKENHKKLLQNQIIKNMPIIGIIKDIRLL